MPLKVLAMTDVRALKDVTAKELSEADIVICTYRLLYSPIYLARRKDQGKPRVQFDHCSNRRPHSWNRVS